MKELLKNRKVAVGITVVIMILATLLGSNRSMTAEAYSIERYFIEGEDGYSIQRDLDTRTGLAQNLLIVAEKNLDSNDLAMAELQDAIVQMSEAETVQEKAAANQQLTAATERMNLVLEECDLSSVDERYRKQIRTDLASCNQTISHDPYNAMVTEYNDTVLGSFPANVLKMVNGVDELETFDSGYSTARDLNVSSFNYQNNQGDLGNYNGQRRGKSQGSGYGQGICLQ